MSARIFVGAVLGGPEVAESAAFTAIQRIRKLAKKLLGDKDVESESGIDYVFHIAGSMMTPDYEGVRHAKFSRKARLLMIQAAVPEKMVSSPEILPFLCELMRQGVIEAKPIFEKANIPFDAERCTKFVDDIERQATNDC